MTPGVAELLRRFAVYGRYYSANFAGRQFELRSHLEIFERDVDWPQAASSDADLVAVMMNPGGSRPLAPPDPEGWAPAVPDRTQYQLMKLVLKAQAAGVRIRHLRVINLSDLRTPKSAELFATLPTLRDDRHSMFSVQRCEELRRALGGRRVPILRAWGLAAPLKELATKAIDRTASREVLGLTDNGLLYRHPLPQRADLQLAWLLALSRQVERMPQA